VVEEMHAMPTSTQETAIVENIPDENLMGAEIVFGSTVIGRVEGFVRDPVSHRVWRVITSYGPDRRRVAVPMEWVVERSASGLRLGVGTLSLDDLASQDSAGLRHVVTGNQVGSQTTPA
jgi:hypothetical protein